MYLIAIALLVAAGKGGEVRAYTDPSQCQHIIKYHLIQACGAAKRHTFENHPKNKVMTNEEIEQRYYDMVKSGMIKGVDAKDAVAIKREFLENHPKNQDLFNKEIKEIKQRYYDMVKSDVIKWPDTDDVDKKVNTLDHDFTEDYVRRKLYNPRWKRSFMGVGLFKTIADPIPHERRGSFTFVERIPSAGAPTPGALKMKCCMEKILCNKADFAPYCT